MDIERIRQDWLAELAREGGPAGDISAVDPLLTELSDRTLPSDDAISLATSDAPTVTLTDEQKSRAAQHAATIMDAIRSSTEPTGELLARHRRQLNVSSADAARIVGLPQGAIDQIERGAGLARLRNVVPERVRALTDRLRIAPQFFAASLARSIPQPAAFAFGYRPRVEASEPAVRGVEADEGEALVNWIRRYLEAR